MWSVTTKIGNSKPLEHSKIDHAASHCCSYVTVALDTDFANALSRKHLVRSLP